MTLRERLWSIANKPGVHPKIQDQCLAVAIEAARISLEEAARECITAMRDSSDADKHERCADAIRALAQGLDDKKGA